MSETIHEQDGAYVLGALSPEDRRRFEEHLTTCVDCAASVQAMAGLPGILGRLPPDEAVLLRDLPDDEALRAAGHRPGRAAAVARRVRARRRRTRLLTAAVLAAVLVIGGSVGWAVVHAARPAAVVAAERDLRPVGGSGLSAQLTVTSVGWGTRLDWSCDYDAGEDTATDHVETASYSLVVHTDTGASTTVATWTAGGGDAKGLVASTAIPADAIASVDIRATGSATPLARTGS